LKENIMSQQRTLLALLLAGALCGAAQAQTTPPANAQLQKHEIARGDPARWYVADATPNAQRKNLRKEITAALQEAIIGCKKMAAGERTQCMKEARATYQHDMANLEQIRTENNGLQ
jgi:hypothetical protein